MVKNPPNNLWIIAAVLAPIAVVTVIIIIITAVLCRKNKSDFKPDAVMNLPQRAKVREAVRGGAGARRFLSWLLRPLHLPSETSSPALILKETLNLFGLFKNYGKIYIT